MVICPSRGHARGGDRARLGGGGQNARKLVDQSFALGRLSAHLNLLCLLQMTSWCKSWGIRVRDAAVTEVCALLTRQDGLDQPGAFDDLIGQADLPTCLLFFRLLRRLTDFYPLPLRRAAWRKQRCFSPASPTVASARSLVSSLKVRQ
jgi:hypothetical protein